MTGVQTCALPISLGARSAAPPGGSLPGVGRAVGVLAPHTHREPSSPPWCLYREPRLCQGSAGRDEGSWDPESSPVNPGCFYCVVFISKVTLCAAPAPPTGICAMGPGTHQQVTVFVFEGLSLINEIDGETESFFFFQTSLLKYNCLTIVC